MDFVMLLIDVDEHEEYFWGRPLMTSQSWEGGQELCDDVLRPWYKKERRWGVGGVKNCPKM